MKPEMSEFSYGFAFTNELITVPGAYVVGALEVPSLQKEGKPGGGYDVKIPFGSPLFLQFKLSHGLAGFLRGLTGARPANNDLQQQG